MPDNVKMVLFVPVQTDVAPEIVPATEAGSTVTVAVNVEPVHVPDFGVIV